MFCFFPCEKVPMKKQTFFLFIQESQLVSTFNHRHQILIHRLGATTLPNLRTVTVQSSLKPALKSNMRQHVTVGSNFSINPLDGCRKCGTFFFVECTRIHVHAVHGDWLILLYFNSHPIYIQYIHRILTQTAAQKLSTRHWRLADYITRGKRSCLWLSLITCLLS